MRKSVLITGGLGFIGSNLTKYLLSLGYEVSIIDNLLLGRKDNLGEAAGKVKIVIGDVRNSSDLKRIKDIDYIVHLASSSASPMFWDDLRGSVNNNVDGFLSILEYARENKVSKVLYASTSSIYGNNHIPLREDDNVVPPNFYSVTKLSMEFFAHVFNKTYGVECIGFRFMSVYGPNESSKGRFANLASQFLWQMKRGERPVIYGNGEQRRDFTNVRDIARAVEMAIRINKRFGSTIFNIGSGKDHSLTELVNTINSVLDTNIKPKYVKNPMKESYIYSQLASLSRIEKELGYRPSVTLKQGLMELL